MLHPATYRWSEFFADFPVLPQKLEMAAFLGAHSFNDLTNLIAEEMTVDDVVASVACPILAVNSEDDIIPPEQGYELRDHARTTVTVIVLPGQVHGGPPTIALPLEADWLRSELSTQEGS